MQTKIQCPACGSESVTTSHRETVIPIPFGEPARFEESINACAECGMEGDFAGQNETVAAEAMKRAASDSARAIIDQLSSRGVSMAHFERALRLPQRTLARWKTGEVSHHAVALLRLIRTFPWLLAVADESFDDDFALHTLVVEASKALADVVAETRSRVRLFRPHGVDETAPALTKFEPLVLGQD
jgi:hypothetical protein